MMETANITDAPKKIDVTHNRQISRGIQCTPKTRLGLIARRKRTKEINKEINKLQEEVFELEGKRERYSKNQYMVEYGELERIQRKINNIEERITILFEERDLIKKAKGKNKKPLRLLPSMFHSTKKTSIVAAKYNGKDYSDDELGEITSVIDQHLKPVNQSLVDPLNDDLERKEITSTIDQYQSSINQTLQGVQDSDHLDEFSRSVEQQLVGGEKHFQEELKNMDIATTLRKVDERTRPLPSYGSDVTTGVGEDPLEVIGFSPIKSDSNDSTLSEDISPISFSSNLENTDSGDYMSSALRDYKDMLKKVSEQSQAKEKANEEYDRMCQANDEALQQEQEYIKMRNNYIEQLVKATKDLQKKFDEDVRAATKVSELSAEVARSTEATKKRTDNVMSDINSLKNMLGLSDDENNLEMGRKM